MLAAGELTSSHLLQCAVDALRRQELAREHQPRQWLSRACARSTRPCGRGCIDQQWPPPPIGDYRMGRRGPSAAGGSTSSSKKSTAASDGAAASRKRPAASGAKRPASAPNKRPAGIKRPAAEPPLPRLRPLPLPPCAHPQCGYQVNPDPARRKPDLTVGVPENNILNDREYCCKRCGAAAFREEPPQHGRFCRHARSAFFYR